MKQLFITIVLLVSLIRTNHADTYIFPAGETPSISLIEAAELCEKMAEEAGIGKFNPTFANLMAKKKPGTGSWVFQQYTKAGRQYVFIIDFVENTATLWRVRDGTGEMDTDKIVANYHIKERKLIQFPVPPPPPEDTDDPFADKATPGSPDPGSNGDGKAARLPEAPANLEKQPANPSNPAPEPEGKNAK